MSQATRHVILGDLCEDYVITSDGEAHCGLLGGDAAFAVVGARIWSESVSVIARVSVDFPRSSLDALQRSGIELSGIRIVEGSSDARRFFAYLSLEERTEANPASHFLRIGQPMPKELLGHPRGQDHVRLMQGLPFTELRPGDLPSELISTSAAHVCPAGRLAHSLLPPRLRELGAEIVTLDAGPTELQPDQSKELSSVVRGLDAFLASEEEARSLFRPMRPDVWEMAETLSDMGCRIVVLKAGARGQYVWDRAERKRWHVAAYPVHPKDPTGAGSAYCGGFLVGFASRGDALEGALFGSVSASLVVEGSGALFALDALPGLAQARLNALRSTAKHV